MDAPRGGADECADAVEIGRAQLRPHTVSQHLINDGMLITQPLQGFRIGRVARLGFFDLPAAEPEVLKEDLPELLGRADVELRPRKCMNLTGKRIDALCRCRTLALKCRAIHAYARLLHRRKHRDKRQLHRAVELHQPLRGELRLHDGLQACAKKCLADSARLGGEPLRRGRSTKERKRRACNVASTLFGVQQIVRQLQIKDLCRPPQTRLYVALRIPERDGALCQACQNRGKMRRRRRCDAPLPIHNEGECRDLHEGRRTHKDAADSGLLRRVQQLHIGITKFRCREVSRRCRLAKERLLRCGGSRCLSRT